VAVETHRVQPGETFSSLAENYYGNRRYAQFLIDSNPDVKDARKLAPGTTIKIPAKPSDDQLTSASRERSAEKPATISSDASAKTGEKPKTYKVKEGDSFYSIAKSQLGGAGKWKKLYELNKKLVNEDPTNLKPGQVLKLPET
jgi:nucleoid-associated protein YgaU